MNLAGIQAKVNFGYAKSAQFIGQTYEWYRPLSAIDPISDISDMGSIQARLDPTPTFNSVKPAEYGKAILYGSFDSTRTLPGDYLVSADDTPLYYFIAGQKTLVDPFVVCCFSTVSFYRPGAAAPTDPTDYSEYVEESAGGEGFLLASGWPISLLTGSRGEKAVLGLPESGRQPWHNWLCPPIPGVRIRTDDKIVDQNGFRYQISACELTDLGYRGTAELAEG